MINLKNVRVCFKDKKALDIKGDINFEAGEKIGIIGSNGAGKSTLINAILGAINYDGLIKTDIPREKIAVHMQFNNYSQAVNTRDIIQMVTNTKIEDDPNLGELIRFFDFDKLLKKSYKTLSGGEKQKLTLILVLWQNSPITIFDEVTTGLDFVTRKALMEKIIDYYRNKDTTILMVSHYYEELENICDKLLYLHEGKVLFFGTKEQMFRKYCTKAVILTEENELTSKLIDKDIRLASSPMTLAAGFDDPAGEIALAKELINHDQKFERLNESIELTVLNALAKEGYNE